MGVVNFLSDPREVTAYILSQEGQLAFDIGANAGHLANLMADNFTKVIAVEPCQESYDVLANTPRRKRVTPLNVAISNYDGTVSLGVKSFTDTLGELFTGDSLTFWGPDTGTREVPCITLDHLAGRYGMPDFVKIDTEGHEGYIVEGGHNVFGTHPRFCIEVHDAKWGHQIQDYFNEIELHWTLIRSEAYRQSSPHYNMHYWMVG